MYTIREATSPAAKKVDNVVFTPDALAGGQWAATLGEGEGGRALWEAFVK